MRVATTCLAVIGLSVACCGCRPASVVSSVGTDGPADQVEVSQPVSTAVHSGGGVAIVNLSEIARQLGETQRWRVELVDRETELNERLELMKMSFEKELEEAKSQLGEEPTDKELSDIKQLTVRYNTSILQERDHARQEFAQFQAALEAEFRTQIKPVALEVAQMRGFSVVMQNTSVFEFAREADITVPVIERLQSTSQFANSAPVSKERVSRKLPGGGQFRPATDPAPR